MDNKSNGVLVGCDERQEWLLKWWWERYEKYNSYPVTFCDFGMSLSAKTWCASKGTLLTELPSSFGGIDFTKFDEKAPWINYISKSMWERRAVWMVKPFALSKTPYEKTLWIDLDCHITGSLSPLHSGSILIAISQAPFPLFMISLLGKINLALPTQRKKNRSDGNA